jgi:hypothetical protein
MLFQLFLSIEQLNSTLCQYMPTRVALARRHIEALILSDLMSRTAALQSSSRRKNASDFLLADTWTRANHTSVKLCYFT